MVLLGQHRQQMLLPTGNTNITGANTVTTAGSVCAGNDGSFRIRLC